LVAVVDGRRGWSKERWKRKLVWTWTSILTLWWCILWTFEFASGCLGWELRVEDECPFSDVHINKQLNVC
jgi:hypothetical protein